MTARLRELADRLDVLAQAVTEARWSEFSMRVPVEPSRDADCVLSQAAIELRAYAKILDAEGDSGAVAWGVSNKDGELWVWDPGIATISKESAVDFVQWANDSKREQRLRNEAPFRVVDFYIHPARSGVVRDEDVRDAEIEALREELKQSKADVWAWQMTAKGFNPHASPKWFVITGSNRGETPILVFTSRGFAEQYCTNNPNEYAYEIYAAIDAARKGERHE